VLELGCGTGRLLVPLARGGAVITGVDRSAAMLDAAQRRLQQHGAQARLVHADLNTWEVEPFDAAILACNTLNLLDDRQRAALLRRLAAAAAPGATLAADLYVWCDAVAALPEGAAPRRSERLSRATRATEVETVHVDPRRRVVLTCTTASPGAIPRRALTQHLPELPGFLQAAREAGWEVVQVADGPQGGGAVGPRVWVWLRR
jgi:SAM-dependent methyltransferase